MRSNVLAKVVEFCKHHKAEPMKKIPKVLNRVRSGCGVLYGDLGQCGVIIGPDWTHHYRAHGIAMPDLFVARETLQDPSSSLGDEVGPNVSNMGFEETLCVCLTGSNCTTPALVTSSACDTVPPSLLAIEPVGNF